MVDGIPGLVRKIKAKQILQLRNQGLSRPAIESAQRMTRHSIRGVLDAGRAHVVGDGERRWC